MTVQGPLPSWPTQRRPSRAVGSALICLRCSLVTPSGFAGSPQPTGLPLVSGASSAPHVRQLCRARALPGSPVTEGPSLSPAWQGTAPRRLAGRWIPPRRSCPSRCSAGPAAAFLKVEFVVCAGPLPRSQCLFLSSPSLGSGPCLRLCPTPSPPLCGVSRPLGPRAEASAGTAPACLPGLAGCCCCGSEARRVPRGSERTHDLTEDGEPRPIPDMARAPTARGLHPSLLTAFGTTGRCPVTHCFQLLRCISRVKLWWPCRAAPPCLSCSGALYRQTAIWAGGHLLLATSLGGSDEYLGDTFPVFPQGRVSESHQPPTDIPPDGKVTAGVFGPTVRQCGPVEGPEQVACPCRCHPGNPLGPGMPRVGMMVSPEANPRTSFVEISGCF